MTTLEQIEQFYQYRAILQKSINADIAKYQIQYNKYQEELNEGSSKSGALRGEVKQLLKRSGSDGTISDNLIEQLTKKKKAIEDHLKSFDEGALAKELENTKKQIDVLSEEYKKIYG